MAEQSHRDEMNAAIRAQRERHAAPRTIAPVDRPPPEEASPEPEPQAPAPEQAAATAPPEAADPERPQAAEPPHKSLLDRLRGR